jgi:predicted nucleic-acid-binding protein
VGERRAALGQVKALDTNVLARFVLGDDEAQSRIATRTLAQPCFVSDTVLLETAWLLSSRYGLDRPTVVETLKDLLALPELSVSNPKGVAWAIERFRAGADFADMIHIISSHGADSFVSFEKRLVQLAGPDSPLPIETLG